MALSDEQIDAVTLSQWGEMKGDPLAAHRAYARAIEAEVRGQDAALIAELEALRKSVKSLRAPRIANGQALLQLSRVEDGVEFRVGHLFSAEQVAHGKACILTEAVMHLEKYIGLEVLSARTGPERKP